MTHKKNSYVKACPRKKIEESNHWKSPMVPKNHYKLEQMKMEDCVNFYTNRYTTIVYNKDCKLEKYPLKPRLKQGHWTTEEDKILLDIVDRLGPHNWEKNSIYHPTRNGKQMRERWLSHLQGVNKDPFTEEEVAIIYYMQDIEGYEELYHKIGTKKEPSAKEKKCSSDQGQKYLLKPKAKRGHWTAVEDTPLLERFGPHNWIWEWNSIYGNGKQMLKNGCTPNSRKNVYHNVVAKSLPNPASRHFEWYRHRN
ncbi:10896_t:CDS:2 [Paraglomus brasilianum]|uniref:10896_t:CDS:1 n=1 Tax=Paraglomus brasilianum TaxID=144538 RepID=A0A9N9A6Y0_9GLOM|nr:10896_t:CDS:2 [Paraglomus brasilianum]